MLILLQDGKINCLPQILCKRTILNTTNYDEIGFLPIYKYKMVFFDIKSNWELFNILKDITKIHRLENTYDDVIFILNLYQTSFNYEYQLKFNELQRIEENNKRSQFKLDRFSEIIQIEFVQLILENQHMIFNFPYEIRKIENDFKFIELKNYCCEINEFKHINKPNWTLRNLLELKYELRTDGEIGENFSLFNSQFVESIIVQNLKLLLFDFGKYKNQDLFTIISIDPAYINWCFKNIKKFNLGSLFPDHWWSERFYSTKEPFTLNESKRILIEIFGIELGNKIFDDSLVNYLDWLGQEDDWEYFNFFSTKADRVGTK